MGKKKKKEEGFFSQLKNQIIAGVGIILTTLGGIFIDEVKSFVGIEDEKAEPQTEVVQENNQSVNVEGPTIVVNIPEQKTETKTIIKEVPVEEKKKKKKKLIGNLNERKTMKGFNKWWKENGQGIGFILGIVYLNILFLNLR